MARYCVTLAGLLCLFAQPGVAAEYYVDNSCTNNGNGRGATCATAAGNVGPTNNLQAFLDSTTLQPGDTVFIRQGRGPYISKSAGRGYETEGFNIRGSGTAASPITISNYPGESPLVANCADNENSLSACPYWTMSAFGSAYLRITGLRIRGGLRLDGNGGAAGIVVDHVEITVGHESNGSGNWAGLRLEKLTGASIHHNNIHDIEPVSGYSAGSTGANACIKLFTAVNSTVEYNTFDNCSHDGSSGAIDDKQDSVNNIFRYNYFTANTMALRIQAQPQQYSAATGTKVYQNVMDGTGASPSGATCVWIADGPLTGVDVYQNTIAGYADGVVTANGTTVGSITTKIYNNIFSVTGRNTVTYSSSRNPALQDYNAYTSGRNWTIGGTSYTSLASVQAATAYDDHSQALSSFGFVSSSDLHLGSNSTAKGAGRVGGVSSGAVVDQGAYANGIACVGHTCDGGAAALGAPRAPSEVRIIR